MGGIGSIALQWTANSEPDLAGYRVFRAAGSTPAITEMCRNDSRAWTFDVEFDDRHGEDGQRIAFAEAAMCPDTGISGHGVQLVREPSVNPFALRIGTLPRARGHCVS